MTAPNSGPSARDIAQMLNTRAEALAFSLLPNGRKAGPFFCVGSTQGEPGDSLKIRLSGHRQGGWADYSRDAADPDGKGDMLKLIERVMGLDTGGAIKWARGWLGLGEMDDAALRRALAKQHRHAERQQRAAAGDEERRRRNAEGLWFHSAELLGTPAQKYLEGRAINFAEIGRLPRALRFCGDVWHGATKTKLPAMVSAMIGPDGRHMASHITYLEFGPKGWKVRKATDPKGRTKSDKIIRGLPIGTHIPLNKGTCRAPLHGIDAGTDIYISEGIEDGLSVAMALPQARVVAGATLGGIGALAVPPQAGDLIIICQHDPPGSPADESLDKQIAHQQRRAREQGSARQIRCMWPEPGFKDFNEQVQAAMANGGTA